MLRIFYDSTNKVATFVATEVSTEEIEKIANTILHERIEYVSQLKGNGFASDDATPKIPVVEETAELPFKVNTEADAEGTVVSENKATSNEIVTNPIPEDTNINTSLLSAPVKDAPAIPVAESQKVNTDEEELPDEEFVFNFGGQNGFKGKSIMDAIIDDPTRAFSYFKWVLGNGILKNKTPNEEVFKKDALRQMKTYFGNCEPQEGELANAAYVLLLSIDENTKNEILSIFGYGDIEEFYKSNNTQNFSDAIKMAIA